MIRWLVSCVVEQQQKRRAYAGNSRQQNGRRATLAGLTHTTTGRNRYWGRRRLQNEGAWAIFQQPGQLSQCKAHPQKGLLLSCARMLSFSPPVKNVFFCRFLCV